MEHGVIKWYKEDKGYGFITREAGEDVFLHRSHIKPGSLHNIREGARVEFDVKQGPKGLEALNVVVADS